MKKIIHRLSLLIFLICFLLALIIMVDGRATEGKDFGPGSYYYTDIPGWQEIFDFKNIKD